MTPEPGTCTARWATSNAFHLAGDLCGEPMTEEIGDSEMCSHHYQRALDWFYKRRIEMPLKKQREYEESLRKAAEADRLAAEARSIVYYLRATDGLIKIGFSTNYPIRLQNLRQEYGPLRLFLAYAGGRKKESEAHAKFKTCHVRGEWFRPDVKMLLEIQRLRRAWDSRENRLPQQVPVAEIRALIKAMREELAAADPAA